MTRKRSSKRTKPRLTSPSTLNKNCCNATGPNPTPPDINPTPLNINPTPLDINPRPSPRPVRNDSPCSMSSRESGLSNPSTSHVFLTTTITDGRFALNFSQTTTGINLEAVISKGKITCVVILFLHCLSCVEGNITNAVDGHQKQQVERHCAFFKSDLYNSSGPLNGSMCSIQLLNIQCRSGLKKKCLPLVTNEFKFACCIDASGLQNEDLDDQCIMVTHIRDLDKYVAQCYGKEECEPLKPDITSPIPVPQTVGSKTPVFGIIIVIVYALFMCVILFLQIKYFKQA